MEFYPAPAGVSYAEIVAAISSLLLWPFGAARVCLRRRRALAAIH